MTAVLNGQTGGASLPIATGAGEVPVSTGAGTSYVATSAGDVVGGETPLARLSVASAVHHWRLDESASPFADLGSGAASLATVGGAREYDRAGVYARYGATMQRSPASAADRAEATVSIASGADLTLGVTVANETGTLLTPAGAARIVAMLHDGGSVGSRNGLLILTNNSGAVYANVATGASSTDLTGVTMDWSRPHRIDVTRDGTTGATILYVDGIAQASQTIAGTMGALTLVSLGGHGVSLVGTWASALLCADLTVHTSVLSAATLLSRADVCRRLVGG